MGRTFDTHDPRAERRSGVAPLVMIVAVFVVVMNAGKWWGAGEVDPSARQRVAATMVKWGVAPDGVAPPVDPDEQARYERLLFSDISEERVRAARWLAARGVRSAGSRIADAMNDPGTVRPCQLAHSLGSLGDERWLDQLAAGARQRRNADLRVCSVIAMRKMASAGAVEVLLELTDDPSLRTAAVAALGEIGDARALPRLRRIAQAPGRAPSTLVARRAVERIEILAGDDPVPALLARIESSMGRGEIDAWAARHLARRADPRSVEMLAAAVASRRLPGKDREIAAAALLALGEPGEAALARLAQGEAARSVAHAALSLLADGASPPALTTR